MFSNYDISQIKRSESRKYFEDVLQSYYSKNYRAAMILLYNLTIDDLYNKLILMHEKKFFNLATELKQIEELIKSTSKYSELENKVYNTYKEKNILNHDTIDVLEFFKKIRDKCAHPSFFSDESYNPYPEEVYMIIKRVYNDILIVEAFIKDPYTLIKNDIEAKEWGTITDVIMEIKIHEENYIPFFQYFSTKYFDKMTDNNFQKIFHTLIKLIIIKKDNWTIVNQYKNAMLMESIIQYLQIKGKISILYDKYEWTNIEEAQLIDDDAPEIYNREWFPLTNLYKILGRVPKFIDEIKNQNEIVFKYIKNEMLKDNKKLIDYWEIFYNEFDEVISDIQNKSTYFYENIINNVKTLSKYQKIKITKMMMESIPEYNGFDKADTACVTLVRVVKSENLQNADLEEILSIMNDKSQIYSEDRRNSVRQMKKLDELGISLKEYTNLNNLLGE